MKLNLGPELQALTKSVLRLPKLRHDSGYISTRPFFYARPSRQTPLPYYSPPRVRVAKRREGYATFIKWRANGELKTRKGKRWKRAKKLVLWVV